MKKQELQNKNGFNFMFLLCVCFTLLTVDEFTQRKSDDDFSISGLINLGNEIIQHLSWCCDPVRLVIAASVSCMQPVFAAML